MGYKKYFLIALGLFMLVYPDYFFGTLAAVLLLVILVLFIIDIAVDVYLIIALFIKRRRKR